MLHLNYFITRRGDMTPDAFRAYWLNTHGPIVKRISLLRRYLQSHRVEAGALNTSSFDGCAEAWMDDEGALQALMKDPGYLDGALADEPNFIDMQRVAFLHTTDRVVLEGNGRRGSYKGLYSIKRRPGLSLQDFRRHWHEENARVGMRLPGLRRYLQCDVIDSAYRDGEPSWDGIAQIYVEDPAAFQAMVASPEYKDFQANLQKFVGQVEVLFVQEFPQIG